MNEERQTGLEARIDGLVKGQTRIGERLDGLGDKIETESRGLRDSVGTIKGAVGLIAARVFVMLAHTLGLIKPL